jgi:hypothetical protein
MADQHEPPQSQSGLPFWVKAFGVAALAVVLLLIVVLLVSGGNHGPGRHGSSPRGTSDEKAGAALHRPFPLVELETA